MKICMIIIENTGINLLHNSDIHITFAILLIMMIISLSDLV